MVSALAVRRERAPKVGEAHERYAVPDTLVLHLAYEGLDGAVHLQAAPTKQYAARHSLATCCRGYVSRGTIVIHDGTWGAQGRAAQGIAVGNSGSVENATVAGLEHSSAENLFELGNEGLVDVAVGVKPTQLDKEGSPLRRLR